MEFNVTFSLFYAFDWKFIDLMLVSFLHGETCAPKVFACPSIPDWHCVHNLSRAVLRKALFSGAMTICVPYILLKAI